MSPRRNPNLSIALTATSHHAGPSGFLSPRTPRLHPGHVNRLLLGRSPPPSPGLPAAVPRKIRRAKTWIHSRAVQRIFVIFCGATVLFYMLIRRLYATQPLAPTEYTPPSQQQADYEVITSLHRIPQDPSVVIIRDRKGHRKWTVSIPAKYDFPLRPSQYHEMCTQSMEISHHLSEAMNGHANSKRHQGYYHQDPYFMDPKDAQVQGVLPYSPQVAKAMAQEGLIGSSNDEPPTVCEKSLTFVMETSDAGFGKTLMQLWMAYGLAMKEGRAFFVDDTRWSYGKFTSYFVKPPMPSCAPPPKTQIVPCPHTARHLVVSAVTTSFTFGHQFDEEFEDPKKMEVQRQHRIFGLLRTGYEALFHLRKDDQQYVDQRAADRRNISETEGGFNIGLHIRRGDRHPYEYQFSKDYIPVERFLSSAEKLITGILDLLPVPKTSDIHPRQKHSRDPKATLPAKREGDPLAHLYSHIVLGSDDPLVYILPDFKNAIRAQDRIVLGTKAALEAMSSKKNPFIDEISGWDGGFFRDIFWSLGRTSKDATQTKALKASYEDGSTDHTAPVASSSVPSKTADETVPDSVMRLREFVGRGYMLDLAVLSKMDGVVCTVSSVGCRLLAVMLGWDESINHGRWVNVDGSFHWRGIMW